MKISRVSLLLCYFMRYKIAIIGCILSLICVFCIGKRGLTFLILGFATIFINMLVNTTNLFETKFNKFSFIKKRIYNKYKEEISFKCTIVYDDISKEYKYIPFTNEEFYICNIYLLVIKTYQKEKYLAYECVSKNSTDVIFMASSKFEVTEFFCEFLRKKIRKIHSDCRQLKDICESYSEIEREIEGQKYSA